MQTTISIEQGSSAGEIAAKARDSAWEARGVVSAICDNPIEFWRMTILNCGPGAGSWPTVSGHKCSNMIARSGKLSEARTIQVQCCNIGSSASHCRINFGRRLMDGV